METIMMKIESATSALLALFAGLLTYGIVFAA
jgi:hypothetical protein